MKNITNKSDLPYEPSTIENVDMAVYNWVNDILNLHTETSKGWKKTPVIWVTGERSWQIKNNRDLRDSSNNFILPVITVERTEISKDPTKKGKYWGDVRPFNDEKGGSIAIQSIIKQDKTSNFANADSKRITGQPNFKRENKKIIYETKFVPMVVYATMTYVIDIKTEYQQQMNDLVQPFITLPGTVNYLILKNNGHRYEAFIEPSYSQKNNVNDLQQNERLFNTQITIKVLAHLVGKGRNDDRPKISVRENIVEIKFPKEHIILSENQFIYPPQPKKWVEKQRIEGSNPQDITGSFGSYGTSLSGDAQILLLTSIYDNENGTNAGSVSVFKQVQGKYQKVQKLTASTDQPTEEARFGINTLISRDKSKLFIGAYRSNDKSADAGSLYVFQSGSLGYEQVQIITASGDGDPAGDRFGGSFGTGISVSEDANTLLVSSFRSDENGTSAGSVYVFRSGSAGYYEVQKLTASGADGDPAGDEFGTSLQISGDSQIIAVGAYAEEHTGRPGYVLAAGAVYIFESGSGGYSQVQKIEGFDRTVSGPLSWFGYDMRMTSDASKLVVAARYEDQPGQVKIGTVNVFKRVSNVYVLEQKIVGNYNNSYQNISSLAINQDASLILAASNQYETGVHDYGYSGIADYPPEGAIFSFQSGSNGYELKQTITKNAPINSTSTTVFGRSIAVNDEGTVFVTAIPKESEVNLVGPTIGAAYVFRYTDDY